MFIQFKGKKVYIPGVYSDTEIISTLKGPTASFQVPMLMGQADYGIPYTFPTTKATDEAAMNPFIRCDNLTALNYWFGYDSHIATAFAIAARHGLPYGYCACMSKLTRASIVAQSGAGPVVNELTIYSRLFGAPGTYHKIAWDSATSKFTLYPVKRSTLLTANAAGAATRIYVKDNSWITDGMTLSIGCTGVATETKVVATNGTGYEFSSTGQKLYWVDLTSGLANPMTTAAYGLVCVHGAAIVGTGLTTGQKLYDWINTDPDAKLALGCKKESTFTNTKPNTVALALMRDIATWGTMTAGTSPTPVLTDYTDFITSMDSSVWDDFLTTYAEVPRAFLVIDPTQTIHQAMRNWAIQKRASTNPGDYPIKVVTGCAWQDTSTTSGTTTSPNFRAADLDNEDVVLVANGRGYLGAFLSHAPAIFGMLVKGGVKHNLTQDRYVGNDPWEVKWDQRVNNQLEILSKAGVVTNRMAVDNGGAYYVVNQGIDTLQANLVAWNTDATTCLIEQRDLQDFVQRDLDWVLTQSQVGQDETDQASISAALVARATGYHVENGHILPNTYKITSITLDPTGPGWVVADTYKLPNTVDYITTIHRVMVGE